MKKYILVKDNPIYLLGTTLKVPSESDYFNMGLHATKNKLAVLKNRQQFADDMHLDLNRCVFANQTHSDHLHQVTLDDLGKGVYETENAIADCDALYTKEKNVCIGVFHADCVPVLIVDPIIGLGCAIHAGWQGTVKEITRKTIAYLKEKENVQPENLKVYIGASISQSNFEVGVEVIEKVKKMSFDTSSTYYFNEATQKGYVDNKELNRLQCILEGIPDKNIIVDKNCTYSNSESFFSYRKDKECGRHLSFIMLKGEANERN
ncbi:MAG: peptidoglycan editing factor PgeF [Traorella sp.]